MQPGRGKLTVAQADKLREQDQAVFEEWMHRVFPDRPIVELDSRDSIFHTIYDLDDSMTH